VNPGETLGDATVSTPESATESVTASVTASIASATTAARSTPGSTRRRFLAAGVLSAAGATLAPAHLAAQATPNPTPGAPPAFGTAPAFGPAVSTETFAQAEKLVEVELTEKDRAEAAGNWRQAMAPFYERRVGPRVVPLPASVAPATVWNPMLPGQQLAATAQGNRFVPSTLPPRSLPSADEDIAFATVPQLSQWLKAKQITSERLTNIYLERLRRFNPKLNCVITLTPELAIEQARKADAELAAGHDRGPLHGIPWGSKDLLDTAGIPTTYGAEPFRNRIPQKNAVVVQRLADAGAVLVAKLSLGALALNDIWFGGQTVNPWNLDEGASGSSAGPGAAVAAGLVGFAIGSETGGSIVSPSMRCGVEGLRPTYGRVARTGAMTLCWSLDKLGPMARGVEDTMLVLQAISGPDAGDVASVPSTLNFDAEKSVQGLRVGYFPKWLNEPPSTDVDRAAFALLPKLGMVPVPVSLPDWPYDALDLILFAEGAAAFEELVLSHKVDELKMQVPDAWPNSFRQARFLSAVDFVQADRMRRRVAEEMARIFSEVDVLLVPSLRDETLTITNFTGQPSLTVRTGFVAITEARSDWAPDPAHPLPHFSPPRRVPHGVTFIGRLFDEGTLANAALAIEKATNATHERPKGF
jgi:Asp-tRNA(Asn)/Glu-tRNA(Gln) amidotransferase A subunit family amidase